MPLPTRRSLSLFVCWLLISLSLAACGDSGNSATSSKPNMTLNVGQISNAVGFFPLYVALQKNFIKDQGLTLNPPTPPQFGAGAKLAAAVESNSIEIAAGALTDAFTISKVDAHIRILGALTNGYTNDVIVSKKFEQQTHLTATSSLADKVKALVGKKIGIAAPGSATEALLIYLFRSYGYDTRRDATLVSVGGTDTGALAALTTGRIDALSFFTPTAQEAEARGIGDTFISPIRGDVPAMQGQVHIVLYAKQNIIDTKLQAVQAFIRAIAKAEAFIQQNPDQATVLMGKYLKLENDMKTTNTVFSAMKPVLAQTPQINQQGYDAANQFHVKAGLIAIALPYNDLVAADTINKALA